MKRFLLGLVAAASVAAGLTVGPAVVAPDSASQAQAHHTRYQNVYHSNSSVYPTLTLGNDVGGTFRLGRGASSCCYNYPTAYVGAEHDLIVTSREYPRFAQRYSAAGWHALPRLASPGHLTIKIVNNGGS